MNFIPIVTPFLIHWSWLRFVPLGWLELGFMESVTGRQGMLSPPKQLIAPLVYPEVRVCPILKFLFPTVLMRLITVRYLCYRIKEKQNLCILIQKLLTFYITSIQYSKTFYAYETFSKQGQKLKKSLCCLIITYTFFKCSTFANFTVAILTLFVMTHYHCEC
jgi:hypothetical protein